MSKEGEQLPSGWVRAAIGQLIGQAGVFVDGDWVESKDQDPGGDVRLIQLADVGDGEFRDRSARFLTTAKAHELGCTFLEKGDVLIARMPDPLGRCCIFPIDSKAANVTVVDVCIVRVGSSPVDSKYLMYAINSASIRNEISELQSGSTRKRISRGNLATIKLPIAPLNEQRRIVAKIEELFSEVDKGVETLANAREQLKAYRHSVLKHAFEGKLTEMWRTKNADKIILPDALLEQIKVERTERYKTVVEEWRVALGKLGAGAKKPVKPKSLRQLSKLAGCKKIKGVWPIVELGDLLSVSSGMGLTSQQMRDGPFAVYGGNGINGHHDEYFVEEPELVIGRVGAKCGVTHITLPKSWVTDNALIVTPLIASFEKRFFKWLLEFKNLNILGSSTGQPVISGSKIYPVEISFPSYAEQAEIVRVLEANLEAADVMEAEIDASLARAEALRQSILRCAFSGQLVSQDIADEPAPKLIERIRVEREGSVTARRRDNKKDKKVAA
jgi:type I restriction enzyme S subunit